jgi:hypothetical protein
MLQNSDVDLTDKISDLASEGIEAGYLVPTDTGLNKSIMDAHESLRAYLRATNFHDFDLQEQGPESKVVKSCQILSERGWVPSKVSLYRPNTKSGDPRIWISGLTNHAQAGNLLALIVFKDMLYAVNASRGEWKTFNDVSTDFGQLVKEIGGNLNPVEDELLRLIEEIHRRGFVKSTTNADNGVGDTLESLLGIKRNSSHNPDYKGIELKASRLNRGSSVANNRSNLFSLVPNWALSNLDNGAAILDRYGYVSDAGIRALQVTLNNRPNAQGLYLSLSSTESEVQNLARKGDSDEPVVLWLVKDLQDKLTEKHPATFWVKAESRQSGSDEEFLYKRVVKTSRPLVQNFGPLVSAGKIEMDYTFSEKLRASGKPYVRDHGYLWKIAPKNIHLIFPSPKEIVLGSS